MYRILNKAAFIFLISLATIPALYARQASGTNCIITGQITDYRTGKPIQDANVFLANTTIGTASDKDGKFQLKNIRLGSHELIISFIGYEVRRYPIRFTAPAEKKYNVRLKVKVLSIPEVTITAQEIKDWKENAAIFKKYFLGTSENAQACTITNIEILEFVKEKGNRPFKAFAAEPLIIENSALGYTVFFDMLHFEAHKREIKYSGYSRFEAMKPRNKREEAKWTRNRLESYRGSLRHFLAALYDGRHKAEGFHAYQLPHFPRSGEKIIRNEIRSRNLLKRGELSFEKILQFDNYIEVTNVKEMEPESYIDYRISIDPDLINASYEARQLAEEPRNQTSLIQLNKKDVIVDSVGMLDSPLGLKVYGFWSFERVGDLLPSNYEALFYDNARLASEANRDYYKEGMDAQKAGQTQKALDIWLAGRESLEIRGKNDPRIGISFIDLVTEKGLTDYFEAASDMYLWAFSPGLVKKYRKTLTNELLFLKPLLTDVQFKEWNKDLKKSRPLFFAKIRKFWIEKDPTPTTQYNERTLEHWQRIAYARKNFQLSKSTPYGTDDRGTIWVKYGLPDRQRKVQLGTNEGALSRWIENPESQLLAGAEPAQSESAEGGVDLGNPEDPAAPLTVELNGGDDILSIIRFELTKYNHRPTAELWAYHELDTREPLIFIFGPEYGRGSFGLRTGIEDFINPSAFQKIRTRFAPVLPGAVLQTMYYDQLASFDDFFARRYNDLETEWEFGRRNNSGPNIKKIRSMRQLYRSQDKFSTSHKFAAREQSVYRKAFKPIRIFTTHGRFLDNASKPIQIFTVFAFPHRTGGVKPASLLTLEEKFKNKLHYSIIVRDKNLDEIRRQENASVSTIDHSSVFKIQHTSEQAHYAIAVKDVSARAETADKDAPAGDLPGIGQYHVAASPPLNPDPKKLEVSDLILGVIPEQNALPTGFPYPIIPSMTIWKSDPLQIYFEVYNLKLEKNEGGRFSLDIHVFKLEKKGKKFKRKEMVASSFAFASKRTTAKEQFGIDISNLENGSYELEVLVKDLNASKKKKRVRQFDVISK